MSFDGKMGIFKRRKMTFLSNHIIYDGLARDTDGFVILDGVIEIEFGVPPFGNDIIPLGWGPSQPHLRFPGRR